MHSVQFVKCFFKKTLTEYRKYVIITLIKGGDNMILGERIKLLRKTLNLSQSEFGKKLGITESAVCSYENNRRIPSEQVIMAICREFNVNRPWLMDDEKKR